MAVSKFATVFMYYSRENNNKFVITFRLNLVRIILQEQFSSLVRVRYEWSLKLSIGLPMGSKVIYIQGYELISLGIKQF